MDHNFAKCLVLLKPWLCLEVYFVLSKELIKHDDDKRLGLHVLPSGKVDPSGLAKPLRSVGWKFLRL